jgi:RHS repeat-associated protein
VLDLALVDVAGDPIRGPPETIEFFRNGKGDVVWSKPSEVPLLGGSQVGNDRFLHGRPYIASLGLYDHRARFYEPGTQLFLEPDPLGPVDSPNLYQAFGFDGMNVVDPWGMMTDINFSYGGPQSPEALSARSKEALDRRRVWCAANPVECQALLAREAGLARAMGGVGQATAGVGALAVPEPTLTSKVFGWTAFVRGVDNVVTGAWQLITGKARESAFHQTVEFAATESGMRPDEARMVASHVETTVDVSSTLVASGATVYSHARSAVSASSGGGGVRPHPNDPNIPGGPGNYRGRYQAGARAEGMSPLPENWDVHHMDPQRLVVQDHPLVRGVDVHNPTGLRGVPGYRQPGTVTVTDASGHVRVTNVHAEIDVEIAEFLRRNPTSQEWTQYKRYLDWRWGHTYWEGRF